MNVGYLGTMITNDARCTCEKKSRIGMVKAAFNKNNNILQANYLNLRNKPVKCYIWSISFYDAETSTLRKIDHKYLESFQMWCWRRMERISWTDHVKNEEVLLRIKEQRKNVQTIQRRKANWIAHILHIK